MSTVILDDEIKAANIRPYLTGAKTRPGVPHEVTTRGTLSGRRVPIEQENPGWGTPGEPKVAEPRPERTGAYYVAMRDVPKVTPQVLCECGVPDDEPVVCPITLQDGEHLTTGRTSPVNREWLRKRGARSRYATSLGMRLGESWALRHTQEGRDENGRD